MNKKNIIGSFNILPSFFLNMIGIVIVVFAFSAILALPVMFLWNYVIPTIFNLQKIDWSQAWALCLLFSFLGNLKELKWIYTWGSSLIAALILRKNSLEKQSTEQN